MPGLFERNGTLRSRHEGRLPNDMLVVVMPLVALGWVLRPRTISFNHGLVGTLRACVSFLSWGRWEEPMGTTTPGVFRSPGGPILIRWILIFCALVSLSVVFSPPPESGYS